MYNGKYVERIVKNNEVMIIKKASQFGKPFDYVINLNFIRQQLQHQF